MWIRADDYHKMSLLAPRAFRVHLSAGKFRGLKGGAVSQKKKKERATWKF